MLKGKSVGWQSKIDNLRIEEAAHSFCKAIDFAPEEEKEDLKNQAVDELKRLGLALASLRKNRFSGSPDKEELNGFKSIRKVLVDSLSVLVSHGNAVDFPNECLDEIAIMMNAAAVAALNFTRKVWAGIEHPSDKDFSTYLEWLDNIENLILEAIETRAKDFESDIVRWKNLAIVVEEPIDKCSYASKYSRYSGYYWAKSQWLTKENVNYRKQRADKARACAASVEKQVETQKAADEAAMKLEALIAEGERIKAYWEEHKEEKEKLESEKKDLEERLKEINDQVVELDKQIKAADEEEKIKGPFETEEESLHNQIKTLNIRKANLGIFAGKEKKQISEEIDIIEKKIAEIAVKVQEEKNAKSDSIKTKIAPVKAKKEELDKEIIPIKRRISDINDRLSNAPKEENN